MGNRRREMKKNIGKIESSRREIFVSLQRSSYIPFLWKSSNLSVLTMGFPINLAAESIDHTAGDTIETTDWILSEANNSPEFVTPTSNPSRDSPPSPVHLNICRSLQFESESESLPPLSQSPPQSPPPTTNPLSEYPREEYDFTPDDFQICPSDIIPTSPPPGELLAERMRPRTIDEVVGQDHLLRENSLLRSAIDFDFLPSIVLWGPPGTGKTSIARAIVNSNSSSYRFVSLSAVTCGVKEVRNAVDEARNLELQSNKKTVLFMDEVHRFNKSQQDSFLPIIEDGSVVFMAATTENPSFHLITPLLSRCRVLKLNPLSHLHIGTLLRRAVADLDEGLYPQLGFRKVEVDDDAIEFISCNCDGDARVALNALEASATSAAAHSNSSVIEFVEGEEIAEYVVRVTLEDAKEVFSCNHPTPYDKDEEVQNDIINTLIESMRGNDANAAIYLLAKMLEGGEQPLYIARKLIRFASEDVGLADPLALGRAVVCYQACHSLGMPECNVNLAECVTYLALAPKSSVIYKAMEAAQRAVRDSVGQNEGVPFHLRNAPTKLMKEIGYGKGYIYTPDDPFASQSYLPPSLQGIEFLDFPGNHPDVIDENPFGGF